MTIKDLLQKYNAKRDFKETQEPAGAAIKKTKARKPIFVVQKHAATRLHWDFRLELDGVLKSWAVTNEPVSDPAVKRLAVRVEDHPLSYATFAGDIPKGQYGGGHVDIWDNGTWEPIGDPHQGLDAGKLSFHLTGKRMRGHWTLVRMRGQGKRENWLLIKAKDDDAVVTAPALDKPPRAAPKAKAATPVKGSGHKAMRIKYDPVLALRVDVPPDGDEWLHEIKYDGYRALLDIRDGKATIVTRNGLDWTHKFPAIVTAAERLKITSAAIDGEIIVMTEKGVSDFGLLQRTLSGDRSEPMQFMAFDLLQHDGTDLTKTKLIDRKKKLQALLKGKKGGNVLHYSDHVVGEGQAFFREAKKMHVEGIIAKNANSFYQGGRKGDWLKIKLVQTEEFVIGGLLRRSDDKSRIGAVLLGTFENGHFTYAGKSGTGFPLPVSDEIIRRAKKLASTTSSFTHGARPKDKNVEWLKPSLVGVIEYTEMTQDGQIRHGVFKGLREDKPAAQVTAETITPVANVTTVKSPGARKPAAAKSGNTVFAGIAITHPERVVYPELGLTKGDIAAYYDRMADVILPYLRKRPTSIMRCPDGLKKACFIQRHVDGKAAEHVTQLPITDDESGEPYFSIDSKEGLLSLVQFGAIEFHPWGSQAPKFDRPNMIVFDLDPDPKIDWPSIKQAALLVKTRLAELGLDSLPKTTGGKGLHVVVPIQPLYDWDKIKAFARGFAEALETDYPDAFVMSASKAKRSGKIFIDYLRNDYANTAVAPFSLRARPDAGFAMTLTWATLKSLASRDDLTLSHVLQTSKPVFDPWVKAMIAGQKIPAAIFKKFKA